MPNSQDAVLLAALLGVSGAKLPQQLQTQAWQQLINELRDKSLHDKNAALKDLISEYTKH